MGKMNKCKVLKYCNKSYTHFIKKQESEPIYLLNLEIEKKRKKTKSKIRHYQVYVWYIDAHIYFEIEQLSSQIKENAQVNHGYDNRPISTHINEF